MRYLPLFYPVIFFMLASCGGEAAVDEAPVGPPNVVILFCDDLGYGDLTSYGHPVIRTPNLDQLAKDGLKFTDFYSASPACTASRYALLTGRYPVFSGFDWVLNPDSPRGIHPDETTIAERLKTQGYATACFGKWHLGTTSKAYLPLQNGFDEYLGLPYSNDMIPPKWQDIALLAGNDTLDMNPDQDQLTRIYTERAVEFIRRNQEKPFFVYLPYAMPHVPLHPGPEFAGKSPRGLYGDVVEEIDWSVGVIRRVLEELDLAENTLLFFTSDNGPWIIKGDDGGSAGPLRDGKGSTWEGGMREPAIAWWPGRIPPGTVSGAPASTLDLYPTLLQLTGIELEENYPADGRDISSLLFQDGSPVPERPFFYHGPGNVPQAVRVGRWKLHIRTNSQTGVDYFNGELPLLFDLAADTGEEKNVAAENPGEVARLYTLLLDHQSRIDTFTNLFEADRLDKENQHIAFQKAISLDPAASERYGPATVLTDGLPGDPGDLKTMTGIRGDDFQATIDLGDSFMAERLRINFLHDPGKWVFLPRSVEILISLDGEAYKSRGILRTETDWKDTPKGLNPFEVIMRAQPVRYVKVRATSRRTGPSGHPAAGQPVWVMTDEVWVE